MLEGFKELHWKSFRIGLVVPFIFATLIITTGVINSFSETSNMSFSDRLSVGLNFLQLWYIVTMLSGAGLWHFIIYYSTAEDRFERMERKFLCAVGYSISAIAIFFLIF